MAIHPEQKTTRNSTNQGGWFSRKPCDVYRPMCIVQLSSEDLKVERAASRKTELGWSLDRTPYCRL